MIRPKLTSIRLGVLLSGGLLVPSLPAAEPVDAMAAAPQAHLAYIPADAELGTIRFEGISRVHVPARIQRTANAHYCAEAAFRDSGGSALCPSTGAVMSAVAYEVTYSYTAKPMASDELANRHFVFSVYFRYDELPPEVQQAASARKLDRADTAGYFAVNTQREPVQRVVIDSARSSFCQGAYVEGSWIRNDESCHDDIHYRAITAPSDYITVRVNAAAMGRERTAHAGAIAKGLANPGLSQ
jgi:hypothetical protein